MILWHVISIPGPQNSVDIEFTTDCDFRLQYPNPVQKFGLEWKLLSGTHHVSNPEISANQNRVEVFCKSTLPTLQLKFVPAPPLKKKQSFP